MRLNPFARPILASQAAVGGDLSRTVLPGREWISLKALFLCMLMFGLVMVHSASLPLPSSNVESVFWRLMAGHPVHILIGLVAFWVASKVPLAWWQRQSGPLLVISLLLLMVVVVLKWVAGDMLIRDGALRSIPLGPLTVQPAEFAKVTCVLFAAAYVIRRQDRIQNEIARGLLPIVSVMTVLIVLLMAQPDLGSTGVIAMTVLTVLFLGNMSLRVVAGLFVVTVLLAVAMVWITPWRLMRVASFLEPCAAEHARTVGYQLCGALVAFGNGGLMGSGLGTGVAKLGHLPLPHTDFIFAMIGEELGFLGVTALLAAFGLLVWKAMQIGRHAMSLGQLYGGLVAQGIGVWFGIQAFVHAGVNTGLLPTKGLTLPFISHGGSAMLACCLAMGILSRIEWEARHPEPFQQTGGQP